MEEKTTSTIDNEEIERFSRIADEWWNPVGKFKPLHRINPLRIGYIKEQILHKLRVTSYEKLSPPIESNSQLATHNSPLKGIRLLDIGCGGGLISEPMARLGAQVTGIDASEKNIRVASLHAERSGLAIDYRCATAENLLADIHQSPPPNPQSPLFDVVLALEIVEHVASIPAFVQAASGLVKPGGLMIWSSLNRTAKSFALAIVGAEYVLRWLPRGTHSWNKFIKPSELCTHLRHEGMEVLEMTGMVMNPLTFTWELTPKDLSVNYLLAALKS